MSAVRHTVGTLVAAVSADDLADGIRRLYWANQEDDLDAYMEMRERLIAMKPVPTTMSCGLSREWSDDDPPEPIIDVHGYEMGDDQRYAIGFVPWATWLSMDVRIDPELELSDADVLANILYEMSFYGWGDQGIGDVKDEIIERKEEVDRMIEEGRVDELPVVDLRKTPG